MTAASQKPALLFFRQTLAPNLLANHYFPTFATNLLACKILLGYDLGFVKTGFQTGI
ncbi:LacI family transcriptional regulator [Neisseria wadsworthii 9715]|uniref:LacI family transcriptional regulator n=1 Tax=Neisseria wadsworthii 9715 TaxID=1030841 RepID=G4CMI5_9NEIS|nr:LacI family transcriptional regulator [Neisseria wadsworthii 9715]